MAAAEDEDHSNLAALKEQISAIEQYMAAASDGGDLGALESLIEMHNELQAAISELEESLLAKRKSVLLAAVDAYEEHHAGKEDDSSTFKDFLGKDAEDGSSVEHDDPRLINGDAALLKRRQYAPYVLGQPITHDMLVLAPYTQEWGHRDHHYAVVHDVDDARQTVSVFFLAPISTAMQPCDEFLEGHCENSCIYSHGFELPVSEVKPPRHLGVTDLNSGDTCLIAQKHSKIWQYGKLESLYDDGMAEVRPMYSSLVRLVSIELIRPAYKEEIDDGCESPMVQSEADDEPVLDNTESTLSEAYNFCQVPDVFGAWQEHTKGIGSKIMQKLGYTPGTGLGMFKEGRLEPIDAYILPTGQSLDFVMQKRQAGKLKLGFQLLCRHNLLCVVGGKTAPGKSVSKAVEKKDDVFDAINSVLAGAAGVVSESEEARLQDISMRPKRTKDMVKHTFVLEREILTLEAQLRDQAKAINRNLNDARIKCQFEAKRDMIQGQITSLQCQLKMLQRETDKTRAKKKSKIF